jgi:flavin reductase (DIM6/NTAB) family NADH-FMN oxidoreductase RutF
MTVSSQDFRNIMAHMAAHVHLVTTDGPAGRAGLTATSVTSVSDTPALMLVCLNGRSETCLKMEKNEHFCINGLTMSDQHIASRFARPALDPSQPQAVGKFETGQWLFESGASPLLQTALYALQCKLVQMVPMATHAVAIGEVMALHEGTLSGKPLLYHQRGYTTLAE